MVAPKYRIQTTEWRSDNVLGVQSAAIRYSDYSFWWYSTAAAAE